MRPLTALNAIVFGSAVAISFGLLGVSVVFLLLRGAHPQVVGEFPVVVRSAGIFLILAAASGWALLGLLKERQWRWQAQALMWVVVVLVGAYYWPEPM